MALMFALVYLSKSSMIVVTAVLTCAGVLLLTTRSSRLLLILIVVAAPLGWATYQHAASGRFTLGTSFDGGNLHKGNNENFLKHYPPPLPDNLDKYDPQLANGHVFSSEWDLNDWHQRAAVQFIRSHPKDTLIALSRKIEVLFFSLEPYGSGPARLPRVLIWLGLLLSRLVFWSAVGLSVYSIFYGRGSDRAVALLFLAVAIGCALPYLAGFGYVRHVSVLIYPSALTICRLLPDGFINAHAHPLGSRAHQPLRSDLVAR
jgi:hypothetical protein